MYIYIYIYIYINCPEALGLENYQKTIYLKFVMPY